MRFLPLALPLLAGSTFAAMIRTHEPADVVPHAAFVVLADIDHDAGTARIVQTLRGRIETPVIAVDNLNDLGRVRPTGRHRAYLFLDRVDHRYHLVRRKNPHWILPHSAIVYVEDGRYLGWRSRMSWSIERLAVESLRDFPAKLAALLRKPRAPSPFRPELSPADAKRWHEAQGGEIDGHANRIVREPGSIERTLSRLAKYARASKGEALRRAVQAHLILTHPKTPNGNVARERRRAAYRALVALLHEVPADLAAAVLLDELLSIDYDAGWDAAARALPTFGPHLVPFAKLVLLEHVRDKDGSHGSRAYWALVSMGFRAEAENARDTHEPR